MGQQRPWCLVVLLLVDVIGYLVAGAWIIVRGWRLLENQPWDVILLSGIVFGVPSWWIARVLHRCWSGDERGLQAIRRVAVAVAGGVLFAIIANSTALQPTDVLVLSATLIWAGGHWWFFGQSQVRAFFQSQRL